MEVKEKTETRIETNYAFGFIPYENKYTITFKYLEIKGNSDAKSKPDKHD